MAHSPNLLQNTCKTSSFPDGFVFFSKTGSPGITGFSAATRLLEPQCTRHMLTITMSYSHIKQIFTSSQFWTVSDTQLGTARYSLEQWSLTGGRDSSFAISWFFTSLASSIWNVQWYYCINISAPTLCNVPTSELYFSGKAVPHGLRDMHCIINGISLVKCPGGTHYTLQSSVPGSHKICNHFSRTFRGPHWIFKDHLLGI